MILFLALAQATAPAAVAAPVTPAAAEQGVTSYPASFFAPHQPANANEAVSFIPGFNLDTGNGVRGFEGAAGNVIIDGQRPSSKNDDLQSILQRIPFSQIERIDVIRGGAPGIDMQGKTVLANVIRKKGGGIKGLFAVADQHVNDARNRHLGALRIEAEGSLPANRTWEIGLREGRYPDDGVGTGHSSLVHADGSPPQLAYLDSHGTGIQYTATGAFGTPLLGGQLQLNGRAYHDRFEEPEIDQFYSPAPDVATFNFLQRTLDTEIGGNWGRDLRAGTHLDLVALRTTRDRSVDSNSDQDGVFDDFLQKRKSSEAIIRGVLKQQLNEKLSAELGAEFADNKLDSRTIFAEAVNGGPPVVQPLPAANVMVEEKRTEVFVKASWRPLAAWSVDANLNYEMSDISSRGDVVLSKSLQFPKPRVTVSWTPVAATQLRVKVERYVTQLNFDDFVASSNLTTSTGVTAGNPNLNPEQDWITEVALEQRVWTGASVILTARHYAITDAQDRGPVVASDGTIFDTPTNIGSGTKDELQLDVQLPSDPFGWKGLLVKGSYTYRQSKVTDPTTHQQRAISGMHPHDWNVTVSQDLPEKHLSFGTDLYGGFHWKTYRFNQVETFKLQDYLHPFAEWRPRPDLSLRLELPLANAPQDRLHDGFLIWPGLRSAGVQPDKLDRTFHFPHGWYFRIRKTFG
jgi:outer membrane receptor protein involved in Fe transport